MNDLALVCDRGRTATGMVLVNKLVNRTNEEARTMGNQRDAKQVEKDCHKAAIAGTKKPNFKDARLKPAKPGAGAGVFKNPASVDELKRGVGIKRSK